LQSVQAIGQGSSDNVVYYISVSCHGVGTKISNNIATAGTDAEGRSHITSKFSDQGLAQSDDPHANHVASTQAPWSIFVNICS